jgi:hypothetical protein
MIITMEKLILYFLTLLTLLNAIAFIVGGLLKKLGKTRENERAVLTLLMTEANKRNKSALYLNLIICLYWVIAEGPTPPYQPTLLILGNLLVMLLAQRKVKETTLAIKGCINNQCVAVLQVEMSPEKDASSIDLWLRKTQEEWPPLELEVGIGPWIVNVKNLKEPLLEKIREVMRNTKIFEQKEIQEELKAVLNSHGITHPIDIKGSECIPEIQAFLEQTLITRKVT